MSDAPLRWKLADETGGQGAFFTDDELVERHVGSGEFRGLEFLHVNARRIINEIPAAAQLPFKFTINVYRGCSHACTYCFARPTHEYLGLDIGQDFERRLVVKVNAVERLRAELRSPKWTGDHIAMGTNTDPYQRCEGKYHLTQGVLKALADARNPFSILTKSTLILRDLDLLKWAATRTTVRANFSIGTLDEEVWKASEPGTPHPRRRVEAVRKLNEAGIPCGVLVAPILPGLSDRPDQVQAVVKACVAAGAVSLAAIPLHLRPGVRDHYLTWLAGYRPDLVADHKRRYRSSYLPVNDRKALAALVHRTIREAGGLAVDPTETRLPGDTPSRAVSADLEPQSEQLGLGV
ncbi:MAG TPA: radical SAM protein [Acidimicrobiales bacterium]|nr:radical SAM protein [Acidimicrobiales bacterium]